MSSHSRASERGFTLLELVIAIAVAGILAAISLPMLSTLTGAGRLRVTALAMASKLHEARTQALKRNATARLQLDAAANTMLVHTDGVGALGEPEFLAQGIRYQGFVGTRQIAFDSMGRPTAPPQVITVRTDSGMTTTITVTATGRITVQ